MVLTYLHFRIPKLPLIWYLRLIIVWYPKNHGDVNRLNHWMRAMPALVCGDGNSQVIADAQDEESILCPKLNLRTMTRLDQ